MGELHSRDAPVRERWAQCILVALFAVPAAITPPAAADEARAPIASPPASYHDVLPILLRRCAACHGGHEPEAQLDVRTRATLLRGGKSGSAVVPGDAAASLLVHRVTAGEMPPRDRLVDAGVRPMEPAELEVIRRWIDSGAPESATKPDVAASEPDPRVTDADRSFWAFQPPRAPAVPRPRGSARVRNPIDLFVLDQLEAAGMTFSPEASPVVLLRRATFDLTGLPPSAREVEEVLAAGGDGEEAYERIVDRLLASPRYGERWGRIWLDIAGYADSEGKREQDLLRPSAWRYRDYVIRAFNDDKPYDRFLLEQIAGDELQDYEHAREITPEMEECLVATGFLRMAPDPTWASITNFIEDRLDVIADEIDILGSSVLGLTLRCARCHDHKIDPIPQRDYYRMLDVFKGALDEHDWLRSGWHSGISTGRRADRELPFVTSQEQREREARNAALNAEIEPLRAQVAAARAASRGDDASRLEARIASLESKRPQEIGIRALWDRGEPSPTYILRRGDPQNPGPLVGPGVPSVLTDGRTPFETRPPWPGARSTGRRLALARWLARAENPLVARVIANRVWKHHFGRGIVETLGDFGKAGSRPTHPELLDWLALELVRSGWSVKALHRAILTSTAYRQVSGSNDELDRLAPDNRLLSRMSLRRLDAEQVHDALLVAADRLAERPYGPPDPLVARADGLVTVAQVSNGWRRSVYASHERKQAPTLLDVFDLPPMNPSCGERRVSTVVLQALELLNDGAIRGLAQDFARSASKDAGGDRRGTVIQVYLRAFGRPPRPEELDAAAAAIAQLENAWQQAGGVDRAGGSERALEGVCHAVLNSAEFIHVD
ncbi:MAG TPA: PSD1 and planctomycete cytochrome C domain-containing protein [Planctomycetota bacterium]|nr:PSD1 and planctomycete cytochrome C domain-containing protein [Planctomycetota bacterium]